METHTSNMGTSIWETLNLSPLLCVQRPYSSKK